MIARFTDYLAERSRRERWLLAIMTALFALVILWFGMIDPVERGLTDAKRAQSEALYRNAAIAMKVRALKQVPRGAAPIGDLAQRITQSAGEAGFTLERAQPQGAGRVDIAIAAARPTALFGWIAALEGQGVIVESLSVRPAPVGGSVSAQALLKTNAQ